MSSNPTLAILGPGLLGGSIALATRSTHKVKIWGRSEAKLDKIRHLGFDTVSTSLRAVIQGAQLIIITTPVPYMSGIAKQLLESGLEKDQLITDVGSVKELVVNSLQPLLGKQGYSYIGSHPMAGAETQGFEAAHAKLFNGASCIITPDEYTKERSLHKLKDFWTSLGATIYTLSPSQHDTIVAQVSHLPHVLSAVCASVALQDPENYKYAGKGLKDTTRIASGCPELWTGILMENSESVAVHLAESIERMQQYCNALNSSNSKILKQLLTEDKSARDQT